MRDSKDLNTDSGFLPTTEMEEGITDGGEGVQYLFPGVQVVEVVSVLIHNVFI